MSDITNRLMAMLEFFDQPEKAQALVEEFYAETAVFQDPFQRVEGRKAINGMFRSFAWLFKAVDTEVLDVIEDSTRCVIHWEMTFIYRRWPAAATIKGVTWLELDEHGQCEKHTDYWDLWQFFKGSLPFLYKLRQRRLAAG